MPPATEQNVRTVELATDSLPMPAAALKVKQPKQWVKPGESVTFDVGKEEVLLCFLDPVPPGLERAYQFSGRKTLAIPKNAPEQPYEYALYLMGANMLAEGEREVASGRLVRHRPRIIVSSIGPTWLPVDNDDASRSSNARSDALPRKAAQSTRQDEP